MYNRAKLCLFMLVVLASGVRVDSASFYSVEDLAKIPSSFQTGSTYDSAIKASAGSTISELPKVRPDTTPKVFLHQLALLRKYPGAEELIRKSQSQNRDVDSGTTTHLIVSWQCTTYDQPRPGVMPIVTVLQFIFTFSRFVCQNACNQRSDCGGYTYFTPMCRLYNINNRIIEDHLIDGFLVNTGLSGIQWYSKDCDHTPSFPQCHNYDNIHENRIITNTAYEIISSGIVDANTAEVCHSWCMQDDDCVSVAFRESDDPAIVGGSCQLYSTTCQDLIDGGYDDCAVDTLATTYDRHCCYQHDP